MLALYLSLPLHTSGFSLGYPKQKDSVLQCFQDVEVRWRKKGKEKEEEKEEEVTEAAVCFAAT